MRRLVMTIADSSPARDSPNMLRDLLVSVGGVGLDLLRSARELWSLYQRTFTYVLRGRREPGLLSSQLYQVGNRSLLFLCVVMAFMGMIFAYQAGEQMKRVVADQASLGPTFIELLVKDLAPTICAFMLATRVGAGIAAEIGSMVVTEQVDALTMCAADPVDYLIKPRLLASMIMTPALTVVAGCVAIATGALTAQVFFGVSPRTFLNFSRVSGGDVLLGLTKCLAYGTAIPMASSHCGLTTRGGSEGVGWATTRAIVNSSLTVIVLDLLLSMVGFWLID